MSYHNSDFFIAQGSLSLTKLTKTIPFMINTDILKGLHFL